MKFPRATLALAILPWICIASSCKDDKNAYVAPPPPEVTVANPTQQDITPYLATTGLTEAVNQVEVRARVSGYIEKIAFKDGQFVKAGETLYIIDQRPFKAALDRAVADLDGKKAALDIAEARFKRIEEGYKNKVASEFEFLERKGERDNAKAAVAIAITSVESAKINYDFTTVTSPIDGRARKSAVEVGTLVSDGILLTDVVNDSRVYAYFNISENELLNLRANANKRVNDADSKVEVQLGTAAESGYPHRGTIDYAANKVDSSTGTIQVRGIFENPDGKLYAGLFVRVRIPGIPVQRVLVPDTAVGYDQAGYYVLAVAPDNTVSRRGVKVDNAVDRMRPVLDSSLTPSDTIIVNGILRARPGSKVTPLRAAPTTAPETATAPK